MNTGIGIDSGTFHTVSTFFDGDNVWIPERSILSIALRAGNTTMVGVDAISQMETAAFELIMAPKLKLSDIGVPDQLLQSILRKLVGQSLEDLGRRPSNAVLTVPPGWTLGHCQILKDAIEPIASGIRFIHEPIALLIAAMYLSPKNEADPRIVAKLDGADSILICDWGAGTVDVALVKVDRKGHQYEFSCIGEFTEKLHGGTSIARGVIQDYEKSQGTGATANSEKMAYRLQEYWQGEGYRNLGFEMYEPLTRARRLLAAKTIGAKIKDLFDDLKIPNGAGILFLIHGGPLESPELRLFLEQSLVEVLEISSEQLLHIGNDFAGSLPYDQVPYRRDALVATGAALFAARGEALPEFEYEIALRDSFGQVSSSARLARSHNLEGIQVINPPYSGVDYFVDVQQLRGSAPDSKTSIKTELRLHVRQDAVVMYRIREAGVGYVLLEAIEAQNQPAPKPFPDARSDQRQLPERSTRFSINLE